MRWHERYQSEVISITIELVFHYREKLCGVLKEKLQTKNTSLRHPWHHVYQFATTTIHHDNLWPVREKLSEQSALNLQLPQSRAWRDSLDGRPCQKQHWSRSEPFYPPASSPKPSLRCVPHTKGHHKCQDLSYKWTRWLGAQLCIP